MNTVNGRAFALAPWVLVCVLLLVGAARAEAAPAKGVFELLEQSRFVVIGEVVGVAAEPDRVEVSWMRVRHALRGVDSTAGEWRVVHRRRFPSDPDLFRDRGESLLVLATALPAQSSWAHLRSTKPGESPTGYVAESARLRNVPRDEISRWAQTLGAYLRVLEQGAGRQGATRRSQAAASFLATQLTSEPASLAPDAAYALAPRARSGALDLGSLEAVITWLGRTGGDLDARRALAAAVVTGTPATAFTNLTPLFANTELRAAAIGALLERAESDTTSETIVRAAAAEWAADPDPEVRESGVAALALAGDEHAVQTLGAIALDDPDDDVAARSVEALDALRMRVPAAYGALGRVARDANVTTAVLATQSLGLADDPLAVEALSTVFESSRVEMHVAAVIALFNMNQPAAHEAIQRLHAEHPDIRVRRAIEAMAGSSR